MMHRSEVKLRTYVLGEPAKHIRPLSEVRAIENGANMLAEGFLFAVAASLIIGETWRSSRSQSKRREDVNDQLEDLGTKLSDLSLRLESLSASVETQLRDEKERNDELAKILEHVVEIGFRGGWAGFENTPLSLPRIQLVPPRTPSSIRNSDTPENTADTLETK
ncbi:hypothetical protein AX17_001857 [Amanita inopinata Kibby_2008]|nr:hypothetical protein AX17_001857 [Amanita inopinata Kibby_2008]